MSSRQSSICLPESSNGIRELTIQQQHQTTFSSLGSLPIELWTQIITSLTWKDVLRIRMTCKWLSEATISREIWARLVQEHISNHPFPPRLERPLGMYTTSELERIVLKWKRVDAVFGGHYTIPVGTRKFFSEKPVCYSHLVEGGRWLLNVDPAGAVTYYDLDAETMKETPLIPEGTQYRRFNEIRVAFHYDAESPTLKLTLALFLTDKLVGIRCSGRFHIWNISLLLDSSQHGAGLAATRLARFPLRPTIFPLSSISLFCQHLAFEGFNHETQAYHIFIINWKDANGQSDIYPWRMLQASPVFTDSVDILSGCQILVTDGSSANLYDYTTAEETTDALTFRLPLRLWSHTFDRSVALIYQQFSRSQRLYTRATSTCFILRVQDAFYILDIHNDPHLNVEPSITKFMNNPQHPISYPSHFGYSTAISFDDNGDCPVKLLQYHAQYDHNVIQHIQSISLDVEGEPLLLDMDEHMGRVVIITQKESSVVDLAPTCK